MRLPSLLIVVLLVASPALAEVRLLTGGADEQPHAHDSTILDVSADGDLVLFLSGPPASGSTPGIEEEGLYIRRVSTNALRFVGDNTVAHAGVFEASMSDDGRYVSWASTDSHIYWRDVNADITRWVTTVANNQSRRPILRGDGLVLAFASKATNLIADSSLRPTTTGAWSVYLYDVGSEQIRIASLASNGGRLATGVGGNSGWNEFDFSRDGSAIVFSSDATDAHPDRVGPTSLYVYRRNVSTGAVDLLNRNPGGAVAYGIFSTPRCDDTANRTVFFGQNVGFFTSNKMDASVPTHTGMDLYAKDASSGEVWWASRTTDQSVPDGAFGPGSMPLAAISGDGGAVAFASTGTRFVSGNTDPAPGTTSTSDIFRVDLGVAGGTTTTLVSESPNGSGNVSNQSGPLMSGNGGFVAFSTRQVEAMLGTGSSDATHMQGFGVGLFVAETILVPSFVEWASALPVGQQGAGDNPAGDGVPNAVKYMLGMNGNRFDRSRLPVVAVQAGTALGMPADSSRYLTLQVRVQRYAPPDHTWVVRAASTLEGLSEGAGKAVQVGAPVADGDFDVYQFRYPTPLGGGGSGFMDLMVTVPATVPSFAQWAWALPADQRGPADNPAHDKVPNAVKYLLGMSGVRADRSQLPKVAKRLGTELGMPGDRSAYLTLEVRVRRNLPVGHGWVVRAADTPAGLSAGAGAAVQVGEPVADGKFDVYLFRYPTPFNGSGSGRGFMAVDVTVPTPSP